MLFDAFGGFASAPFVILGAAAMTVGCGTTVLVTEDDAGPASAGAGGSAHGGSAHGGAVGEGGAVAGGGAGGSGAGGEGSTGSGGSLCDGDCGAINTPQCYEAVCNEGSHPGPVGQCVVVYEADFTPCDDGKACSVNDVCLAGTCVGDETNCN